MWLQFFSQDAHFTIHLFAALACIAVSWLYLDAWLTHKTPVGLLRWLGFGLLSLSFLTQSTIVEQSVLGTISFNHSLNGAVIFFRLIAYLFIIVSQLLDPLMKVPETHGIELSELGDNNKADIKTESSTATKSIEPTRAFSFYGMITIAIKWLVPIGGLVVFGLYLRRSTKGLERHLKFVAWAFLFIGISDLIHLSSLLNETRNPVIYSIVRSFGPLWWAEQIVLLFGIIILGKWVWGYLTKRFFSQLFMIFVSMTVVVFLAVSITFTALLLKSSQADFVSNLHTAAQVLKYALVSKQTETQAGAQQLANDQGIIQAVESKNHDLLNNLTANYLPEKKQPILIITDAYGEVLLRGHDPTHWGDSLSNDPIIRRSLLGIGSNSVQDSNSSVGPPTVQVESSVPVTRGNNIIGSVTTGINLNEAFVDGLKNKTGLDATVYANNIISATTLIGGDGNTRLTGTSENNSTVKNKVLGKGQAYSGSIDMAYRSYLGSIVPLLDADNTPVGMLAVTQPESAVLLKAGRSVELTFLLTACLLLLSIAPAYFVTKSLVKQIEK